MTNTRTANSSCACALLALVLVVLRIVTLVISLTDIFGGHDHLVLDVLLLVFLW